MDDAVPRLLHSQEPSIRFKTHTLILDEPEDSPSNKRLRSSVKDSPRVTALLSERKNGVIPHHPYAKWFGAHWVLSALADLRYPPGDRTLLPLRQQVYGWLFSKAHLEYVGDREKYAGPVVEVRGLARAHASMEGNALCYLHTPGIADSRAAALADRLLEWQWPDGGWNCDKSSAAQTSSFTESLLPMRGLLQQARLKGGPYRASVRKAAEYFLERGLFRRRHGGRVISERFVRLHYPCYWHYDVLFGLTVMDEAGLIRDERCWDALSLLESKRLKDGGFPAEEAYYQNSRGQTSSRSLVSWGGTSRRKMNEFVTCEALAVLHHAARA